MFITFEGIEGCGKSVQAKELAAFLAEQGRPVVLTREPGGTRLGELLRGVLLQTDDVPMAPVAEALLFSAARSQHVVEVIQPALRAGKTVVCDRYADSTLAYQSYGRGLARPPVEQMLRFAIFDLWPDLTILLDLDPEEGLRRKTSDGAADRIERMDVAFHRRVREGYLTLAAEEPERWVVLDGSLPVADVAAQVRQAVQRRGFAPARK